VAASAVGSAAVAAGDAVSVVGTGAGSLAVSVGSEA
jgi:hypothetical protein